MDLPATTHASEHGPLWKWQPVEIDTAVANTPRRSTWTNRYLGENGATTHMLQWKPTQYGSQCACAQTESCMLTRGMDKCPTYHTRRSAQRRLTRPGSRTLTQRPSHRRELARTRTCLRSVAMPTQGSAVANAATAMPAGNEVKARGHSGTRHDGWVDDLLIRLVRSRARPYQVGHHEFGYQAGRNLTFLILITPRTVCKRLGTHRGLVRLPHCLHERVLAGPRA